MKKWIRITVFILFLLGIAFQVSYAGELQEAPANYEFLEYMSRPDILMVPDGDEYGLGYIPEPVDLSHINQLSSPDRLMGIESVLPTSYDLRTTGKLTPVRDQGACGSCWTFGSHASVESLLLPAENRDFSENNLKNTHGFTWGHCDGGNNSMAMAYFARWSGTINESDDPYNPSSSVSPTGLTVQKHLSQVVILPDDINALKQAIVNNGAVTVSMYWSAPSYNAANYAYYYSPGTSTNHSVAMVGWDDDYSAGNFNTAPPGNGAFLIRNSWGASWGDGGYFWISYYDTSTANKGYQYYVEPTTNYTGIYQYDPFGWVTMFGSGTTDTAWAANIFTSAGLEKIEAVGFYAVSVNESYEVYVYRNVSGTTDPRNGILCSSTTGSFMNAGYYTVIIPPCIVTAGSKFSVVVKATTPGYYWPIPAELVSAGYSDAATSEPGRSFIGLNGTSWADFSSSYAAEACVKAFSAPVNQAPTLGTLTPSVLTSAPNIAQTFSAIYSDADGYTDLKLVFLRVGPLANGINALYLSKINKLYLRNDAGTGFVGKCIPGVARTITNTQGTLNCGATTVTGVGNNLTVNWNITPKAGFVGKKNLYMYARDKTNATAGWTDKGDWTINP